MFSTTADWGLLRGVTKESATEVTEHLSNYFLI